MGQGGPKSTVPNGPKVLSPMGYQKKSKNFPKIFDKNNILIDNISNNKKQEEKNTKYEGGTYQCIYLTESR